MNTVDSVLIALSVAVLLFFVFSFLGNTRKLGAIQSQLDFIQRQLDQMSGGSDSGDPN